MPPTTPAPDTSNYFASVYDPYGDPNTLGTSPSPAQRPPQAQPIMPGPAANPFPMPLATRTGGNLSSLTQPGSSQGAAAGRLIMGGGAGQGAGLSPNWKQGGLKGMGGRLLASKLGGVASKVKGATPWGMGGLAASALGDIIAKKHAKTGGAISGAGKGAATGAMLGSVVPGIGTAIGGILGGAIGGIKGLFGGKKKNKEKKAAEAAAKAQGAVPRPGGMPSSPVASDPYGQLRAETEGRYAPQAFQYGDAYNRLTQGANYQPTVTDVNSQNPFLGGAIGGQRSWGG